MVDGGLGLRITVSRGCCPLALRVDWQAAACWVSKQRGTHVSWPGRKYCQRGATQALDGGIGASFSILQMFFVRPSLEPSPLPPSWFRPLLSFYPSHTVL